MMKMDDSKSWLCFSANKCSIPTLLLSTEFEMDFKKNVIKWFPENRNDFEIKFDQEDLELFDVLNKEKGMISAGFDNLVQSVALNPDILKIKKVRDVFDIVGTLIA